MSRIILKDAYKQDTLDQDKTMSPAETVRRVKEKMTGLQLDILEETLRIDSGRLDIPVYFSVCGSDAKAATGTAKQMGKGATPQQAEASAVMELVERFSFYSFMNQRDNFRFASHREIGEQAVSFDEIVKSVHDESGDVEEALDIFQTLPMNWTEGFDLTRQEEVMIPFDWFFAINEFNGACAGNGVEEALSQGICEVVERHVSALVSRRRMEVPAIDPASVTDVMACDMLKKYEKAGVRIYISDFSLDTGIPTVGVLAHDPATFPKTSEIVWTAGTTPNPQKALSRALSETAQLGGDFSTGSNYVASGLPKFSDIGQAEFIVRSAKFRSISDLPDLSDDNIRVEIESILSALSEKNMNVLAISTRHPRLQLPAFYVISPGAHFRERAANSSVGMFSAKLIAEQNPPFIALAKLKQIDEKLPGKYYIQFYLGKIYAESDDPATGLTHLMRALDLQPADQDLPSIYSYMGVCYKEMGEYRKALEVLGKGEALDGDRTDIHNLKGFCYYQLKEHRGAIASFEQALRLNPGSGIDYANIGSNWRELGDTEKAVHHYRIALNLDPSLDFARENLEKLTAESGR